MARGMSPQTGAGIGLNLGSLIGSLMQQSDAKKQEEQLKLDQNGFYSELAQNAPQWGQMSPSEYSATLLATLNKHNLTPGPVFKELVSAHKDAWTEQQKNAVTLAEKMEKQKEAAAKAQEAEAAKGAAVAAVRNVYPSSTMTQQVERLTPSFAPSDGIGPVNEPELYRAAMEQQNIEAGQRRAMEERAQAFPKETITAIDAQGRQQATFNQQRMLQEARLSGQVVGDKRLPTAVETAIFIQQGLDPNSDATPQHRATAQMMQRQQFLDQIGASGTQALFGTGALSAPPSVAVGDVGPAQALINNRLIKGGSYQATEQLPSGEERTWAISADGKATLLSTKAVEDVQPAVKTEAGKALKEGETVTAQLANVNDAVTKYGPELAEIGTLAESKVTAWLDKLGYRGKDKDDRVAAFRKFRVSVGTLLNAYIKAITGAQMSDPEAQRLLQSYINNELSYGELVAYLPTLMANQKLANRINDSYRRGIVPTDTEREQWRIEAFESGYQTPSPSRQSAPAQLGAAQAAPAAKAQDIDNLLDSLGVPNGR